jgi:hypothetical protein
MVCRRIILAEAETAADDSVIHGTDYGHSPKAHRSLGKPCAKAALSRGGVLRGKYRSLSISVILAKMAGLILPMQAARHENTRVTVLPLLLPPSLVPHATDTRRRLQQHLRLRPRRTR